MQSHLSKITERHVLVTFTIINKFPVQRQKSMNQKQRAAFSGNFYLLMCISSGEGSLRNPGTLPALELSFKYLSAELYM